MAFNFIGVCILSTSSCNWRVSVGSGWVFFFYPIVHMFWGWFIHGWVLLIFFFFWWTAIGYFYFFSFYPVDGGLLDCLCNSLSVLSESFFLKR